MRPKILIVDDDARMLYALEQALATSDYDVLQASSGVHALSKVKEDSFALVLLDIKMSVMDGLATARMIRNGAHNRDVPIIFISGFNEKDLISTGYAMGAIDYILKPVDFHVLKSKVRFFVDLYRRTEMLRVAEEQLRSVRDELERALARQRELLQSLLPREHLFYKLPENLPLQIWIGDTDPFDCRTLEGIPMDDIVKSIETYTDAFEKRQPFKIEYRMKRADGSYRQILDSGIPRFAPDSVFLGYIGSWIDLSIKPDPVTLPNNASSQITLY